MKTCLICGYVADAKAETCPECGEGSWSAVAEKPRPAPVKAVHRPAPVKKVGKR